MENGPLRRGAEVSWAWAGGGVAVGCTDVGVLVGVLVAGGGVAAGALAGGAVAGGALAGGAVVAGGALGGAAVLTVSGDAGAVDVVPV